MGGGSDAISYSQRGNKRGLIFRAGSRQESHLTEAAEVRGGRRLRRRSEVGFLHIFSRGVMQMRGRGRGGL